MLKDAEVAAVPHMLPSQTVLSMKQLNKEMNWSPKLVRWNQLLDGCWHGSVLLALCPLFPRIFLLQWQDTEQMSYSDSCFQVYFKSFCINYSSNLSGIFYLIFNTQNLQVYSNHRELKPWKYHRDYFWTRLQHWDGTPLKPILIHKIFPMFCHQWSCNFSQFSLKLF